jgi:DNA adenine methylase
MLSLDVFKTHVFQSQEEPLEISGEPGKTPIIRWAGSKKKLLSTLLDAAPSKFNKYYEPFFGSGIFFLNLDVTSSIVSDSNPHLIQAYEVLRDSPELLWAVLRSISADEKAYYDVRNLEFEKMDSLSRAARFIYLNRYCFNGVYRTNRQGGFNVSRGRGNLGIPSREIFVSFSDKLKNTSISCSDFEQVVDQASNNDFVYLDPPYIDQSKRDRGEYGAGSFGEHDLERLANCAKRASQRGAKVIVSYSECPLMESIFSDWNISKTLVHRSVSCTGATRGKAQEMLISNYFD